MTSAARTFTGVDLASMPDQTVFAVGCAGLLASNAEVQQLPGKGTRLVVVIDHRPPIVAAWDYPSEGAEHASYIAATARAKVLQRGCFVHLVGHHLEACEYRGRPALRLSSLIKLDAPEVPQLQPHSQPKEL